MNSMLDQIEIDRRVYARNGDHDVLYPWDAQSTALLSAGELADAVDVQMKYAPDAVSMRIQEALAAFRSAIEVK